MWLIFTIFIFMLISGIYSAYTILNMLIEWMTKNKLNLLRTIQKKG